MGQFERSQWVESNDGGHGCPTAALGGQLRSTAWRRRTAPSPEAVIPTPDTGLRLLAKSGREPHVSSGAHNRPRPTLTLGKCSSLFRCIRSRRRGDAANTARAAYAMRSFRQASLNVFSTSRSPPCCALIKTWESSSGIA